MNCPPKALVIAVAVALASCTIVVIVQRSRQPHKPIAPRESELPAALSNYSKTFKLNTNPPIWTAPANGKSSTN
jgi:hypothetical protein